MFRVVFQIYRIKESEIVYSFAVYFKCSLSRDFFLILCSSFCFADHSDFGWYNVFGEKVKHFIFSRCLFIFFRVFFLPFLYSLNWTLVELQMFTVFFSFSIFTRFLFCSFNVLFCVTCFILHTWTKNKKHSSYRLNKKYHKWFSIHTLAHMGW